MKEVVSRRKVQVFSALCIVLLALNMRGSLVSYSPLIASLCQVFDVSLSQFSFLTSLPLFCFGIIALCVPYLHKYSTKTIVLVALLCVTLGCTLRALPSYAMALAGTVSVGAGIAVLNVLLPGIVRDWFSRHIESMMGLYSVSIGMSATIGAFIAVPMVDATHIWNAPLMVWAVLGAVTVICWVLVYAYRQKMPRTGLLKQKTTRVSLWKSPIAWSVTLTMGLQSLLFYTLVAWLPAILMDAGYTKLYAGNMLTIINAVSIPSAYILPRLATLRQSQSWLAPILALCYGVCYLGFCLAPQGFTVLWAVIGGFTVGASLSYALFVMVLRVSSLSQVIALSAMAQSIGYLIAAVGPSLIGLLYEASGAWTLPLIVILVIVCLLFVFAFRAGRNVAVPAEETE